MPMRNLIIIFVSAVVSLACYRAAPRNHYATILVDTMAVIDQAYVDKVDRRQLFEDAMEGMVGGLDQYSGYVSPDEYAELQIDLEQEIVGIGILVEMDEQSQRLTVKLPLPNTPAHRAGIKSGDVILEIDGANAVGLPMSEAIKRIQGKKGTLLTLLVQHTDEPQPALIELRRDEIPIESVLGDTRRSDGSWNYFLEEHPNIGYIRLTSFGEKTADELRLALAFADHTVEGLVLDVRDNPGGLLPAACDTCEMFIDQGRIVSTRGRGDVLKSKYDAHRNTTIFDRDLPIAVITNRFSASASEIVAACLQDHGRAVVVGQRTWGKGTVQNIIRLERGRSGALRLTTARYWRPSGKNIHRSQDADEDDQWGVSPDDGWEVTVSADERDRIRQLRIERDTTFAVGPPDGGSEAADAPPQREDRQLEKAIEYLQQRLQEANARARTT